MISGISLYEQVKRSLSPLAYWRFGEKTGTTAVELINALDGTYVGSPTLGVAGALAGDSDTAITLNGTTQYGTVPDNALLDTGDVVTLEAWIKRSAASLGMIMSKGSAMYDFECAANGAIRLNIDTANQIVASTATVPLNVWTHVAATKNGATVKLYLNGVDVTGSVTNFTFSNNSVAVTIGLGSSGTSFFAGSIDEPAIFGTALSAADVRMLFNAGRNRGRTPIYRAMIYPLRHVPVGYWALDEASGSRADSSDYGNNDLTDNATVTSQAGKRGDAAQFTAANSEYLSVAVPAGGILQTGERPHTITCWVYLDSKGANRVIASQWKDPTSDNLSAWLLQFNNSSDRFEFSVCFTDNTIVTAVANVLGSPSTATWYFIRAWFDRYTDTVNIRINEGTVNSTATITTARVSTEDFRIGAWRGSGGSVAAFWNGRIDEFALWKDILDDAEGAALYNNGAGTTLADYVEPPNYSYGSAEPVTGEAMGDLLLTPLELVKESDPAKGHMPLSTFTCRIADNGSIVTAQLADSIGQKFILQAGLWDLEWATSHITLFTGVITNAIFKAGSYFITARSILSRANDRTICGGVTSRLKTAVNTSATTFNVYDASAWPSRGYFVIDSEICFFRGKTQLTDQTWNLTSVTRVGLAGFYSVNAAHAADALCQEIVRMGQRTTQNSAAAVDDLHPIELIKQILHGSGREGIGDAKIPINYESFDQARTDLGSAVQMLYFRQTAINAKTAIENILLEIGGYLVENEYGEIGIQILRPLSRDPLGYWKLEEASGTRVDTMGNNNLTDNNTVTSTTGKVGTAGQFTAANSEYLSAAIAAGNALQITNGESFAVTAWVYMDTKAVDRYIICQWRGSSLTGRSFRLWYQSSSDRFVFSVVDTADTIVNLSASTLGAPATATWYFIAAWWNSATATIHIKVNNGTTDSVAGVIPKSGTEDFRIGADHNGTVIADFWNGRIDEATFRKVVPTAAELTAWYNSGNGATETVHALADYLTAVDTLADRHLLARPQWEGNVERMFNTVYFHYDYHLVTDKYASIFKYQNTALLAEHGREIKLDIFSNGLRTPFLSGGFSWLGDTIPFMADRARAWLERFSRPIPIISTRALWSKQVLEPGDTIEATLTEVTDLESGTTDVTDVPMEVSAIRLNFGDCQTQIRLLGLPEAV